MNAAAALTRAPGWAVDGAMDEADGEPAATARVPDRAGAELMAEAEHAVTASRTPAVTASAGKRA